MALRTSKITGYYKPNIIHCMHSLISKELQMDDVSPTYYKIYNKLTMARLLALISSEDGISSNSSLGILVKFDNIDL